VQLAGVHHDRVAGAGVDLSDGAPRPMSADIDQTDAELVVRVPGKGLAGDERHRLDAGYRGSMSANMVRSRRDLALLSHADFPQRDLGRGRNGRDNSRRQAVHDAPKTAKFKLGRGGFSLRFRRTRL
jgi:thiamine pyrophosphate-dependent acetolactate synthase large subunit-like protein